ncbi:hypothetical protein D3C80_1193190 [compost metagenome]
MAKALMALACLMMPPMYHRHSCDRPAYLSPANWGLPSFQIDMWTCMPEPLSANMGLAMKVADLP